MTRSPAFTRVTFLLWLWLSVAACAGWVLAARFTVAGQVAFGDLRMFLFAAGLGLRSGWTAVYDPHVFIPAASAATHGPRVPMLEPPTLVPLLLALHALPWPAVSWLWLAVGLLTAAGAALLVSWELRPSRRIALVAATLAFYPVWFATTQGQPNPLLLLAIAGAYRLIRARRPYLAGVVLAAGVLKPQMVFLLPLALLAAGQWRVVAAGAAAAAVWIAGSVVLVGPAAMGDWVWSVGHHAPSAGLPAANTLSYYLPAGSASVLVVLAAAGAAFIGWRSRNAERGLELAFAGGLLASIVATPYANPQDFGAWILAAFLIWRAFPDPRLALAFGVLYFVLNPFGWLVRPSPIPWIETAVLVALVLARSAAPSHIAASPASSVVRSGVQGGS